MQKYFLCFVFTVIVIPIATLILEIFYRNAPQVVRQIFLGICCPTGADEQLALDQPPQAGLVQGSEWSLIGASQRLRIPDIHHSVACCGSCADSIWPQNTRTQIHVVDAFRLIGNDVQTGFWVFGAQQILVHQL